MQDHPKLKYFVRKEGNQLKHHFYSLLDIWLPGVHNFYWTDPQAIEDIAGFQKFNLVLMVTLKVHMHRST